MAEGEDARIFQVLDERSGRKCKLQFKDYSAFEQKCKCKFGYSSQEGVVFVLEDEQDIEIDETAFSPYEDGTKFRMRPIDVGLTTNLVTENVVIRDLNTKRKDDNEDTKNTERDDELDVSASPENKKENTEKTKNANELDVSAPSEDILVKESTGNTEKGSDACENSSYIEKSSDEAWCSPEVEKLTSGADYIREEMAKRGKSKIFEILLEAKNLPLAPLNICVTGSSGQGKSKLINTLRNLSPGDDGYAPVGTTETTEKCTGYPHAHFQNIIFWDVPGVGTIGCPRKEYRSRIGFAKYDFFLICSSTRFTEDDAWLANEVKTQKKRFYYLRTKVDQDIDNAYRELQDSYDEQVELGKIKQNCLKNIGRDIRVFLISSIRKTEYDFPSLLKRLIEDAPAEQQRSLTYGLVSVSEDMIESKAKYLKAEIWKTAVLSGMGGSVPIPGLSFAVDLGLIIERLEEYRRQFLLTQSDMKAFADMVSLPEDDFKRMVGLKINFVLLLSPQSAKIIISAFTINAIVEETSRYVPMIGTAIAAGISYSATGNVLQKFLEDIKNDAKKIHTFIAGIQANRNKVGSETHGK